jgi:hypothetical protein
MNSTVNPKPNDDPHDVVVVPPDAVRVAPSDEEISHLLQQAARFHSEARGRNEPDFSVGPPIPTVDAKFRSTAADHVLVGDRRSNGRRVLRGIVAVLLAACIGGGAIAWQTFGYAGKKAIAKWIPQFALTTSLPLEKLWPGAQPARPAQETDAANAESSDAERPAQTAAEAVVPPADPAQLLRSMARDLATVSQEVEQLKANIAELKAGQQLASRDAGKSSENKSSENKPSDQAKVSEPNARSKMSAIPPRPAVARPRKPTPPFPPAQAAAAPASPQTAAPYVPRQAEPQPQAIEQPQADPGLESVPRPPMPVR